MHSRRVSISRHMNFFEQFSTDELQVLRNELLHSSLDSFQTAELLAAFLAQHGYGVSNIAARVAASRIDSAGCTLPNIQEELEKIAFVM